MIIDFHVHVWEQKMVSKGYKEYLNNFTQILRPENISNNYSADPHTLVTDLDEAKIDKAVILIADYSFTPAKMKISIETYVDYVIKVCDEYKDKLTGFVGVDPRHGKEGIKLVNYAIEQNLKGIVLTPTTGFYLTDEIVTPYYEIAKRNNIPIVIHDFGLVPLPFSLKYADLLPLDDILMNYPKVLFVLAPIDMAIGSNLMSIGMRHMSHLYGELSGFSTQFMMGRVPDMFLLQPLGMAKEFYGSKRLLFGSDWPFFENHVLVKDWVDKVKKAKLPLILRPFGVPSLEDEDRENILGRNGATVLGIKYEPHEKKKSKENKKTINKSNR
ncbi:MAG: amidohydrolase family protein [Candidatus Helarchaeota archaeon]